MPNAYKRLGAINPSANTQTNVYVIPAATEAVISTITICNTSATTATFSIAASTTTSFVTAGYIVNQSSIPGNETIGLTFGLTLDATNKYLLASSSASTVVFSAFGSEIS